MQPDTRSSTRMSGFEKLPTFNRAQEINEYLLIAGAHYNKNNLEELFILLCSDRQRRLTI
jgi:hypothetical protein